MTIALAGNANVGKSSIFNQLTGLTQETDIKATILIVAAEIALAIFIGGIAYRLLGLVL